MSGNASRKFKRYKLRRERKKYFGEMIPRDETGRLDLVAYSAAQGRIITHASFLHQGKMPANTKL